MTITRIDLVANSAVVASFNLDRNDPSQSYILKAATGLDAEEIIPQIYSKANTVQPVHTMVLSEREIAFRIGLQPSGVETFSSLRQELYRAISATPNSKITLRFYEGFNHVYNIDGFITKLETDLFKQSPDVVMNILCPDPFFEAPQETIITNLPSIQPIIDDPLSSAPHGLRAEILFTGTVSNFSLTDDTGNWAFTILQSFSPGDVLYLSSERNNRYLRYTTSIYDINIMEKIESGSVWPIVFPGQNRWRTSSTSYSWNSVQFKSAYWGV